MDDETLEGLRELVGQRVRVRIGRDGVVAVRDDGSPAVLTVVREVGGMVELGLERVDDAAG